MNGKCGVLCVDPVDKGFVLLVIGFIKDGVTQGEEMKVGSLHDPGTSGNKNEC